MSIPTVLCRCLHPKRIVNPYTYQSMIVPCGHCEACALNRNHHLSLLCDLEAQSHKYCMFITLTYANRYIPRAQFVDAIDRPFGCDLVSQDDGDILCPADIPESERQKLLDKFYLFGSVPYLRKTDLQKFFKRFRFYVKKITNAKVRYFACGEYGPVHFRPHFHILLFFSDDALFQACEQIVLQSWPFGRCDVQLSRGQCSSYVASYVNSSVFVPKIFEARSIRPFCVHSQKLGQSVLQGERSQVYETSVEQFVRRCVVVNEKCREFNLWRSYYAYYFPKCRGFVDSNAQQRTYSYCLYDDARRAFPAVETTIDLARSIAACIYYFPLEAKTFGSDKVTYDLCRYFYDPSVGDINTDSFDKWIHRIYTELLLSKHFLYFVCDHRTKYEINRKIKMIDDFYSRLDYMHLTEFFENQSSFFESDLFGADDLLSQNADNQFYPYFYDNISYSLADYRTSPAFNVMSSQIMDEFEKRCKHKKLNDINKLLFD